MTETSGSGSVGIAHLDLERIFVATARPGGNWPRAECPLWSFDYGKQMIVLDAGIVDGS